MVGIAERCVTYYVIFIVNTLVDNGSRLVETKIEFNVDYDEWVHYVNLLPTNKLRFKGFIREI